MIAYFSGTGNSALVAKWLAEKLQEKRINLAACIKGQTPMPEMDERPLVLVTPIYGWRVPRLVQAYLEQHCAAAGRPVYFVTTCGDSAWQRGQICKVALRKNTGAMARAGGGENAGKLFGDVSRARPGRSRGNFKTRPPCGRGADGKDKSGRNV